jgi:hypothetical protein
MKYKYFVTAINRGLSGLQIQMIIRNRFILFKKRMRVKLLYLKGKPKNNISIVFFAMFLNILRISKNYIYHRTKG